MNQNFNAANRGINSEVGVCGWLGVCLDQVDRVLIALALTRRAICRSLTWSGVANGLGSVSGKGFEVVPKHGGELIGLGVVGGRIFPGVAWVQDFRGHFRTGLRDGESESGVGLEIRVIESAFKGGIEEGTGPFDFDAAALSGATGDPASVE